MRLLVLMLVLVLIAACMPAGSAPRSEAESQANLRELFDLTHEYLWQLDDYYWHRGQYDRCAAILRLVTQLDPHDVEAYACGAWLMQNELYEAEAEAFLREGLGKNPDVFDLYFEHGFFCYMRERFDEAIVYLEKAITFRPPSMVYNTLAHAYEHAGDASQALTVWVQREEAEPGNLVPSIQIDRILQGDPPSIGPAMAVQSRKERLEERMRGARDGTGDK
jgi:tetratricopeptide (TPR) repeat protein